MMPEPKKKAPGFQAAPVVGTRQDYKEQSLQFQEQLLARDTPLNVLVEAAQVLTLDLYAHVVQERTESQKLCGYPNCVQPPKKKPSRFRSDLWAARRNAASTTDCLEEEYRFCSPYCHQASRLFASQLPSEPLYLSSSVDKDSSSILLLPAEPHRQLESMQPWIRRVQEAAQKEKQPPETEKDSEKFHAGLTQYVKELVGSLEVLPPPGKGALSGAALPTLAIREHVTERKPEESIETSSFPEEVNELQTNDAQAIADNDLELSLRNLRLHQQEEQEREQLQSRQQHKQAFVCVPSPLRESLKAGEDSGGASEQEWSSEEEPESEIFPSARPTTRRPFREEMFQQLSLFSRIWVLVEEMTTPCLWALLRGDPDGTADVQKFGPLPNHQDPVQRTRRDLVAQQLLRGMQDVLQRLGIVSSLVVPTYTMAQTLGDLLQACRIPENVMLAFTGGKKTHGERMTLSLLFLHGIARFSPALEEQLLQCEPSTFDALYSSMGLTRDRVELLQTRFLHMGSTDGNGVDTGSREQKKDPICR